MENLIQGTNLKYFVSQLGFWGNKIGSVKQVTHDGDTIKVYDFGNISVRFLGIDTPEISFEIKDRCGFTSTDHSKWSDYLTDLPSNWPEMGQVMGSELTNYLWAKIQNSPNAAQNHHDHAAAAEDELERLVELDMNEHQLTEATFEFFIPLSYEIFDSYGRLLGFVHRHDKAEQPKSYNLQLLARGRALPYFIWPNINPFRKEPSVINAVYDNPATFRLKVNSDSSLQEARRLVQQARRAKIGVFDDQKLQPLVLEPFELRLLGRKSAPSRWFIDLAASDHYLHPPEHYFVHPPEDRLFIPEHFVALFESKGWQKQH
jgi:endonuclease YncB( thermonuclease family)